MYLLAYSEVNLEFDRGWMYRCEKCLNWMEFGYDFRDLFLCFCLHTPIPSYAYLLLEERLILKSIEDL